MSKTVLFDLVFLTPRQKVRFGPRTQNDDFLGTRPWARAKKTHRFSSSVRNYYFVPAAAQKSRVFPPTGMKKETTSRDENVGFF